MKIMILATAAFAIAAPVFAQQAAMPPMDHSKMPPTGQPQAPAMDHSKMPMDHGNMMAMMNDPANPYGAAEMDMHKKMMMAKAGLPSELWTRKMIEHHRGAIAMSSVALAQATDPQTRRMAQMTIAAQGREITRMQAWLRSHGKPAQ